jgi:hypothetical protein
VGSSEEEEQGANRSSGTAGEREEVTEETGETEEGCVVWWDLAGIVPRRFHLFFPRQRAIGDDRFGPQRPCYA